jgi:pimeloyl-ACP methyl ester carboxylesterase
VTVRDTFVDLPSSPLAPDRSPVTIRCRRAGHGPPLVVLHGGWGVEVYPFDRQIDALAASHHVLVPDRSGYGCSTPIASLPADFHRRAAAETLAVFDALGLDRPVLWGHSDGAIVALLLALAHPDRVRGAIVEASHYYRRKPGSRAFFERMTDPAAALGGAVAAALERDHGARWVEVVRLHAEAWIRIDAEAASAAEDFYDGRLSELAVPLLVVHGARDPRTEPGELAALRAALAERPGVDPPIHAAAIAVLDEGAHSPHSEPATAAEVTRVMRRFIAALECSPMRVSTP